MKMKNEIERFKDFEFISPSVMVDGDLALHLKEICPYNPEKGFVPEYKFAMVHSHTQASMGEISLRVGLTQKLKVYGGHIGYEVTESYRGNRYAARSCQLLQPLIQKLGINPVIITCAPDNIASVRTIVSLGAVLINSKNVKIGPGKFRKTSIYHWNLEE